MHQIGARIPLLQRDTIFKRVDRHVFVQGIATFIHQRDNGRIEFVFYGKHKISLARFGPKASVKTQQVARGMQQFSGFLTDRGSKYAVSGGPVRTRADVKAFLKQLTRDKRYAKATHNTWAAVLPEGGGVKGDDGEAGAGMVILRKLEREGLEGHVIVVTRWFGGTKLGGDRFRRVQDAVDYYLHHADLTQGP